MTSTEQLYTVTVNGTQHTNVTQETVEMLYSMYGQQFGTTWEVSLQAK